MTYIEFLTKVRQRIIDNKSEYICTSAKWVKNRYDSTYDHRIKLESQISETFNGNTLSDENYSTSKSFLYMFREVRKKHSYIAREIDSTLFITLLDGTPYTFPLMRRFRIKYLSQLIRIERNKESNHG